MLDARHIFVSKDVRIHRKTLINGLNEFIKNRNNLPANIKKTTESSDSRSPLITQIDEWQIIIIEKVKQVTDEACKRIKISIEFKILT